jgi:hypothetical protein
VLGGHHIIGSSIGLTGDDGQLGHGGLGVGVQQLGAVADDAAVLLLRVYVYSRGVVRQAVSG